MFLVLITWNKKGRWVQDCLLSSQGFKSFHSDLRRARWRNLECVEWLYRWLSQWWLVFVLLGLDATLSDAGEFDNTCIVSGKWNVFRVALRLYGWVYKTLRLSPLVIEHSVVVMTASSQSRQSQIKSYG